MDTHLLCTCCLSFRGCMLEIALSSQEYVGITKDLTLSVLPGMFTKPIHAFFRRACMCCERLVFASRCLDRTVKTLLEFPASPLLPSLGPQPGSAQALLVALGAISTPGYTQVPYVVPGIESSWLCASQVYCSTHCTTQCTVPVSELSL